MVLLVEGMKRDCFEFGLQSFDIFCLRYRHLLWGAIASAYLRICSRVHFELLFVVVHKGLKGYLCCRLLGSVEQDRSAILQTHQIKLFNPSIQSFNRIYSNRKYSIINIVSSKRNIITFASPLVWSSPSVWSK